MISPAKLLQCSFGDLRQAKAGKVSSADHTEPVASRDATLVRLAIAAASAKLNRSNRWYIVQVYWDSEGRQSNPGKLFAR